MAFAPAQRRSGNLNATMQKERPALTTQTSAASQTMTRRKRKIDLHQSPSLILERVLGLSVLGPCGIAMHPSPDIPLLAFPAGGIVTIYNHRRNRQTGFLIAASAIPSVNGEFAESHYSAGSIPQSASGKKTTPGVTVKPLSCVTFSPDGNYIAAGESGHQPRILIWQYNAGAIVSELFAHKFGVLSVAFSPNQKYLLSAGHQHDGYIYVWNWRTGQRLAYSRIGSKIHSVAFDDTGQFFVTSGFRHFKFWHMDSSGNLPKSKNAVSTQKNQPQLLEGKFGIVGEHKNSTFVDVKCQRSSDGDLYVYSITEKGILVLFTEQRVMEKWVDLKVTAGFCVSVIDNLVVCGCSEGVIRIFEAVTLKYITTLPKPHARGQDVAHSVGMSYKVASLPNSVFPDVVSVKIDGVGEKVTAVYADHSLFIWDIKELKHIGKYRSFLYHSDCVWGAETTPHSHAFDLLPAIGTAGNLDDASPASEEPPLTPLLPQRGLPPNSFVSFSSDGTVRCWNIDMPSSSSHSLKEPMSSYLTRNIYSKELLKILYVDESVTNPQSAPTHEPIPLENSSVRSLKICEDGKLMATGDRMGNIRIFELETFSQIKFMEAHDAEILAMDFSRCSDSDGLASPSFLATAGRDRMIHIFDTTKSFELIQTLDDHSSSITAVRFSENGKKLISSAADKSVIFRSLSTAHDGKQEFAQYHNAIGRATVFDIDVDRSQSYLAAVSQDRRLNIYATDTGKPLRSYRPDPVDDPGMEGGSGALIRVAIDPSGTFVATCGSDKCIRVFEFSTGACVAKVVGHSDLVTSVKFTKDCNRIISTSADGCILIWRIAPEMSKFMRDRLNEGGTNTPIGRESATVSPVPSYDSDDSSGIDENRADPVRSRRDPIDGPILLRPPLANLGGIVADKFLPQWARSSKDMPDYRSTPLHDPPAVRGQWATRVQEYEVSLFSEVPAIERPVAKFSDMFSRRFSIEDMQPGSEPYSHSTATPGERDVSQTDVSNRHNDVIISDLEAAADENGSFAAEETRDFDNNETDCESDHETEDVEATIFVDTSDSLTEIPEDASYVISREPIPPINTEALNSKAVEVSEVLLNTETNEIDDQEATAAIASDFETSSSEPAEEVQTELSLEDYYLQPIDLAEARQSISAEYIRRRTVVYDPSVSEIGETDEGDMPHILPRQSPDELPNLELDEGENAIEVLENEEEGGRLHHLNGLPRFLANGQVKDIRLVLEQLSALTDECIAALQLTEGSSPAENTCEYSLESDIRSALSKTSAKINEVLHSGKAIEETQNDEQELLERYSEKLIALVREKLAQ